MTYWSHIKGAVATEHSAGVQDRGVGNVAQLDQSVLGETDGGATIGTTGRIQTLVEDRNAAADILQIDLVEREIVEGIEVRARPAPQPAIVRAA